MKIKSFKYYLRDSVKNLWRNKMMSLASMTSIAASLLILGMIFMIIVNINSIAYGAKDQVNTAAIYINEEVQINKITEIKKKIQNIEGVESVTLKDKGVALKEMKDDWKENAYLLDDLNKNPFPDTLVIEFSDLELADTVVEKIRMYPEVESISYYREIVEKMMSISNMVRYFGTGIIFILVAISTFIINNTIKLALAVRETEINIMKYVGATNWFIRWPFIVEGFVLGLLGSGVALLCIYGIYNNLHAAITGDFFVLIAPYIISVNKLVTDLATIFVIIGTGIGVLGSMLSMKKYLNV